MTKAIPALAVTTEDEALPPAIFWGLSPRKAAILGAILLATIVSISRACETAGYSTRPRKSFKAFRYTVGAESESPSSTTAGGSDPRHLPQSAYYRPLQASWFGLNFMIFGNHPAAWHLRKNRTSIDRRDPLLPADATATRNSSVALLAAALFAILPANTESVVWVSAIGEPLSTTFEMAALCCFIKRKPGSSQGLILALILYAGALLSHETAILFGVDHRRLRFSV